MLAEVGDTSVYDIADKSYLLVRTEPGADGIKAYVNACLHRGRALRDGPGRVDELLCSFHGFCWSLSGKLKRVPSAWDFPQVKPEEFRLPEVRVGTWGGFVFLNPDPDCGPLEDFLGDLDPFFERWPLEQRYTRVHVSKVIRTQLEGRPGGLHGVASTSSPRTRSCCPGSATPTRSTTCSATCRAPSRRGACRAPTCRGSPPSRSGSNSQIDQRLDDPPMLEVPEARTARQTLAEAARRSLRPVVGEGAEELSDAELVDSYYFTVFPNMHPWGGYNQITYRWRPNGDDHESCIMEVFLLSPFDGERPAPSPELRLDQDQPWRTAVEQLGSLARVFDQDEFNLEAVQKGMKAMSKPGLSFSVYQESKIRHFHALYDAWVPAGG